MLGIWSRQTRICQRSLMSCPIQSKSTTWQPKEARPSWILEADLVNLSSTQPCKRLALALAWRLCQHVSRFQMTRSTISWTTTTTKRSNNKRQLKREPHELAKQRHAKALLPMLKQLLLKKVNYKRQWKFRRPTKTQRWPWASLWPLQSSRPLPSRKAFKSSPMPKKSRTTSGIASVSSCINSTRIALTLLRLIHSQLHRSWRLQQRNWLRLWQVVRYP